MLAVNQSVVIRHSRERGVIKSLSATTVIVRTFNGQFRNVTRGDVMRLVQR